MRPPSFVTLSAAACCLALTLWAASTNAQASSPPPRQIEVWGGICAVSASPSGRLVTTYSPPLLPAGESSSRGGQTLTLDPRRGLGFEGGLNVFAGRYVGMQILASRSPADLGGANGPYTLDLTYVSRQPPDSTPQTFTVHESIPWPDTTGSVSVFNASLNGVVRLGSADHASATASAGLTYGRISGTVNQLAYTTFRMGGHAVLFSDEYHVAVSLGGASAVGFNAGGELNIPAHRRAAFLVGYRYFAAPATDVPVRVSSILNAGEVVNQETPETIGRSLAPAPVRLNVTRSKVVAGLKVAF